MRGEKPPVGGAAAVGSSYEEHLAVDGPVVLRDITLRQHKIMEAELDLESKLRLLSLIDRVGVPEAVMWASDPDAVALVKGARDGGMGIDLVLFAVPRDRAEVGRAVACARRAGARRLAFFGQASRIDTCIDAARRSVDAGFNVAVGLINASRTDPSTLLAIAVAVEESGADALQLPDSLGVLGPGGMRRMIGAVRAVTDLRLEAHCHNDFGLAVANSLAAVEAGAAVVEVVVNGMDPDRSGIATLDEVAVALEILCGVPHGLDLSGLTALAREAAELTGFAMSANKPIVGERAFARRSPLDENPFDPGIVGNTAELVFGKYSRPEDLASLVRERTATSLKGEHVQLLQGLVASHAATAKRPVEIDELLDLARGVQEERTPEATT